MATNKNKNATTKQIKLQERVKKLAGVNIVTCGNCGGILLHELKAEHVDCIECGKMELHVCPDLFYKGMEVN